MFLPPLRDRKDDLEHLVNMFMNKFNKAHSKKILGVSPEVMACFKKYTWPGNIRELENVMEYAFVLEVSNKVTLHSLPEKILKNLGISLDDAQKLADTEENLEISVDNDGENTQTAGVAVTGELDFGKHKEMFEKEFIIKALKTFKGRINQTALHANIPKKTLLRKIEKYGINPKDYIAQ
jgi:DNA-binding NtrC family response regulator